MCHYADGLITRPNGSLKALVELHLLGDVAEHHGENHGVSHRCFADGRLRGEFLSILSKAGYLATVTHFARLLRRRAESLDVRAMPVAHPLRQQHVERSAEHLMG